MTSKVTIDATQAQIASTQELRDAFLIDELFVDGASRSVHASEDDMVVAGVVPGGGELGLIPPATFDDRWTIEREFGVINLGERGEVSVDGEPFELGHRDGLYAGKGAQLTFRGEGARFYVVAVPAQTAAPTRLVPFADTVPVELGDEPGAGRRSLHKYVWGDGDVESSALQFGVTVLHAGSVWNTYPPHRHAARTEIYLYFELAADALVVHLMGEPDHTRHLLVRNEQAVIAPRWSIHSGAGTSSYAFVWAMTGDNRDYGDLTPVPPGTLR